MSRDLGIMVLVAAILFVLSAAAGAVMIMLQPEIGEVVISTLHDALTLEELMKDPPEVLALKLFMNNLQACIILFFGGVTCGLLTGLVLAINGFVVGVVSKLAVGEQGLLFLIAAIAPHGIFELPALLLSGALGFMLTAAIYREWYGEGDAAADALVYARVFITIVIPLLVIAAIIEAFITPGIIVMVV